MTEPAAPTASDYVAKRIKEVRQQRGWSTKQLAQRCAEVRAAYLTASVLMNIESGRPGENGRRRRNVTVDELFVLAYALNVSPLALLLPAENTEYAITADVTASARSVYEWLVGELLPPFPAEGSTVSDEDRAHAWFLLTRQLSYIPESSAHWLVNAELERLRQHGQRTEQDAENFRRIIEARFEERLTEEIRKVHERFDRLTSQQEQTEEGKE